MKVAVVGAGWAGLSAAFHLDQAGHEVTVFEAAHTVGGRARRVRSARLGADIDNGQHILLGAYTHTLNLMERLGQSRDTAFHEERLTLRQAEGSFTLQTPRLPAPLNLAAALLTAQGISSREKFRLMATVWQLRRAHWKLDPGLTALAWLLQQRQTEHIIRRFWQPLCLAALNTPVAQASAQLLATVLRDSLGGSAHASHVLIPRTDLSRLWPERLPARIIVRCGSVVRTLASAPTHVAVDGAPFDAVVVAANAPSAARLLRGLPASVAGDAVLAQLGAFEYRPIATLALNLARPWKLPHAMLMLDDAPQRLHFGQWLFDHSVFMPEAPARLSVVVSDARDLAQHTQDQVAAAMTTQIQSQTSRFAPMPAVTGHELIIEKRATFAALPTLARPGNTTPWPRVWLAGDWTDTDYPAVLEGAVRSGERAARSIINWQP